MFLNDNGSKLETANPIVVEDGRNGDKLELNTIPDSVELEDKGDMTYVVLSGERENREATLLVFLMD